jgi:hypothetical protein
MVSPRQIITISMYNNIIRIIQWIINYSEYWHSNTLLTHTHISHYQYYIIIMSMTTNTIISILNTNDFHTISKEIILNNTIHNVSTIINNTTSTIMNHNNNTTVISIIHNIYYHYIILIIIITEDISH